MLNMQATRVVKTDFADLAAGVHLEEEGKALVYVREDGKTVARPSTGAAGEVFAGVQMSRAMPPKFVPKVESFVVAKQGTAPVASFKMIRTPVAGKLLVILNGVAITTLGVDEAAPDAAGKVNIVDNTLYFNDADIGLKGQIQYHYEPTVTEAAEITGDAPHGGHPGNSQRQASFVVVGDVATTCFDSSVDWSGVMHPKLGPDGIFTTAGSGVELTNVIVGNTPNDSEDFLVLKVKSF